jgi:lysophospholipase L1-like esterase
MHVPLVQIGDAMGAARAAGKDVYRDAIHPNSNGQAIMADVIYPEIEKVLNQSSLPK